MKTREWYKKLTFIYSVKADTCTCTCQEVEESRTMSALLPLLQPTLIQATTSHSSENKEIKNKISLTFLFAIGYDDLVSLALKKSTRNRHIHWASVYFA